MTSTCSGTRAVIVAVGGIDLSTLHLNDKQNISCADRRTAIGNGSQSDRRATSRYIYLAGRKISIGRAIIEIGRYVGRTALSCCRLAEQAGKKYQGQVAESERVADCKKRV